MYKAIIFKEWLKTRRVFFVALTVSLAVAGYIILSMNSLIATRGASALWLAMILKDVSMADATKYLPVIIGVATGIAQMMPEMSHKRLKLTLHLPCPRVRLVAVMLATGVAELLTIFGLQALSVAIYDSTILPGTLTARVMLTMLPWYMAGLYGYLFASAVCLEGTWRMRLLLSLTGIAVVMVMFLLPGVMDAYTGQWTALIVLTFILTILPFGSIARFKEGLQD